MTACTGRSSSFATESGHGRPKGRCFEVLAALHAEKKRNPANTGSLIVGRDCGYARFFLPPFFFCAVFFFAMYITSFSECRRTETLIVAVGTFGGSLGPIRRACELCRRTG